MKKTFPLLGLAMTIGLFAALLAAGRIPGVLTAAALLMGSYAICGLLAIAINDYSLRPRYRVHRVRKPASATSTAEGRTGKRRTSTWTYQTLTT